MEDTDLEERGYDVDITDTEASEDLLYEEVLMVVCNSARRKEKRKAVLERKKKVCYCCFLCFHQLGFHFF